MVKCDNCSGEGEKWILPKGNPFHMRLPQLAQALVKVRCWKCHGSGAISKASAAPLANKS